MTYSAFALNHMAVPKLDLPAFFDLAVKLGMTQVEIRNDLTGRPIIDGTPAATVKRLAEERGLTILSINALQRFNEWTPVRAQEAAELIAYAKACGAKALVLVPVNDRGWTPAGETHAEALRRSLSALASLLQAAGVGGLVEPLGFEECSLRFKGDAVAAIEELGLTGIFKVVHDTFHHHLSGEAQIFPGHTGLIHISGVEDGETPLSSIRDGHRVLVGGGDILGNGAQIRALRAGGYAGPLSFEPFAGSVHDRADIEEALKASCDYVTAAAQ